MSNVPSKTTVNSRRASESAPSQYGFGGSAGFRSAPPGSAGAGGCATGTVGLAGWGRSASTSMTTVLAGGEGVAATTAVAAGSRVVVDGRAMDAADGSGEVVATVETTAVALRAAGAADGRAGGEATVAAALGAERPPPDGCECDQTKTATPTAATKTIPAAAASTYGIAPDEGAI